MRPVNLLPADQRRGESAPSRTGALSYIIVGVLAVVLAGVTAITLINKSVSDKEAEVVTLREQEAELSARAAALSSFTSFEQVKLARQQTVTSLANSRFDWERVIEELARVIPNRVWLVNLTGKVSPQVSVQEEATISLRASIEKPALELLGCARSQRDVARLIAAIGDIDGVTRVAVARSAKPENEVTNTPTSDQVSEDCRTRNFVAQFELVAAFDNVEVGDGSGVVPAPPEPPADSATPAADDGGTAEAGAERANAEQSVSEAADDANEAANIVSGGGE